jgi:Raf kinase inhibitor-like YbhB/YbcL family protein
MTSTSLTRSIRRVSFAALTALAALAAQASPAAPSPFSVSVPGTPDGAAFDTAVGSNRAGCGGSNVSPAVSWSNPPAGTNSLAVMFWDVDAQKGAGMVQWLHYGIPASVPGVPAGFAGSTTVGHEGTNGRGEAAYAGPCPPATEAAHHYVIQVFALDISPSELEAGLSRAQLTTKMASHVLASASVFERYGSSSGTH